MVRRFKAGVSALMLICLLCVGIPSYADEPLATVNIGQAHVYTDMLHTYVDLNGANGGRAAEPQPGYIQGVMDDDVLAVAGIRRFTDTFEGTAYIFLFDVSGSLSDSQFSKLKEATKNWCGKMSDRDRMAIISFGNEVNTLLDYSSDKNAINGVVDSLSNKDGRTKLYDAVSEGLTLSDKKDRGIPKRKVIILLSDGKNDTSGGVTYDEIINKIKLHMIPIYSLCTTGKNATNGSEFMSLATDLSHGMFYDISQTGVGDVYDRTYERLQNSYVIDFRYPSQKTDGAMHTLSLTVIENGTKYTDTRELYMEKPTEVMYPGVTEVNPPQESAAADGNAGAADENLNTENTNEEENGKMRIPQQTLLLLIVAGVVILAIAIGIIALIIMLNNKNGGDQQPPMSGGPVPPYPPQGFGGMPADGATVALNKKEEAKEPTPKRSAGPEFRLVEVNGSGFYAAPVANSIIVGRKSDSDIVISDGQVSAHHCKISRNNGSFYISDLGSTNGTIVNGMTITAETPIKRGDLVLLGTKEYRVD